MNDTIKLLDVVALTVDLPEYNLWRGQVGTVVELLAAARRSKSNSATGTDGHTSRSGCAPSDHGVAL
jgi:hypothetical protein